MLMFATEEPFLPSSHMGNNDSFKRIYKTKSRVAYRPLSYNLMTASHNNIKK